MVNKTSLGNVQKGSLHKSPVFVISLSLLPILIIAFAFSYFLHQQLKSQLHHSVEDESRRVAMHFSREAFELNENNGQYKLSQGFANEIKKTVKEFNLWKIQVFNQSGVVLFSTDSKDIGKTNTHDYFIEFVQRGEIFSKIADKEEKTMEGQKPSLDIVETYIPVIRNGKFIGAFEIYYDITDRVNLLNQKLSQIYLFISSITVFLIFLLAILFFHEKRISIERIGAMKLYESLAINWQNTFDAIDDMILLVDKNGIILRYNKKATDLFGDKLKEKTRVCDLIHGSSCRETECVVKKALENRTPCKVVFFEKGMDNRYFDVSAYPITKDSGEVEEFVHIFKDISEHKKLEQELFHMQKIESIGKLAGGIAHDFRNMLGAIIGHIDLLKLKKPPVACNENIEAILDASQRAKDLTDKLMSFSRKTVNKPELFDLHELINNSIVLFEQRGSKKVKITADLQSPQSIIKGDLSAIQNMIVNICINAIDAMPEGGDLKIVSEIKELTKDDCQKSKFECEPGDYILLRIQDTGEGMSDSVLLNIFDPFFTTKEAGKGTGLGLSVVYGTVVSHKGNINVSSKELVGTEFEILLPLAKSQELSKKENLEGNLKKGQGKVVVVDDEETNLNMITNLLKELGYEPISYGSPREALNGFPKISQEVKFLILDIIMPEMEGGVLYSKLKAICPELKVLFISGFSSDSINQNLRKKTDALFLSKPFSLKEFSDKLKELVGDKGNGDLYHI